MQDIALYVAGLAPLFLAIPIAGIVGNRAGWFVFHLGWDSLLIVAFSLALVGASAVVIGSKEALRMAGIGTAVVIGLAIVYGIIGLSSQDGDARH